jgi:hypothetical protein
MVRLAQWLRDDGLAIPSGVYTIDALADAIVTAARGKGRRA